MQHIDECPQPTLNEVLKEYIGDRDAMLVDFRQYDDNTTRDRLDFKKVRGSVRLTLRKVKTPAEVKAIKQSFLELKIP